MQIKIKYIKIGIILTQVQLAGDSLEMTRGCRTHTTTTTLIAAGIVDRITIADLRNFAMK